VIFDRRRRRPIAGDGQVAVAAASARDFRSDNNVIFIAVAIVRAKRFTPKLTRGLRASE